MKGAVRLEGLVSSHMSVRTARVVTRSLDARVLQGQGRGRNSTREYCLGNCSRLRLVPRVLVWLCFSKSCCWLLHSNIGDCMFTPGGYGSKLREKRGEFRSVPEV